MSKKGKEAEKRLLYWDEDWYWDKDSKEAAVLGAKAIAELEWDCWREGTPYPEGISETRLVYLDPCRGQGAEEPGILEKWRGRCGRTTWLRPPLDIPEPSTRVPRYPRSLTLRECLRSGAPKGAEGAIETYAEHPEEWAQDLADGALNDRDARRELGGRLQRLLPQKSPSPWRVEWRKTVAWMSAKRYPRDFADLRVAVLPLRMRPLAAEAARCVTRARHPWWRLGTRLPDSPLLILYGADGDWTDDEGPPSPIRAVELWTQEDSFPLNPEPSSDLAFKRTPGGPHFKHCLKLDLPAAPKDPVRLQRRLDRFLSALFNRLLIAGRPLRHFGCTLFFPFDPGSEDNARILEEALEQSPEERRGYYPDEPAKESGILDVERQSMLYFLPEMRRLLYSPGPGSTAKGLEPLEEWRLELEGENRLTVRPGSPDLESMEGRLESVRLFRYFNGTYLLALRVTPQAAHELAEETEDPYARLLHSDGDDWWQALVYSGPDDLARIQALQLTRWLAWTRLARVLYQTFPEQVEEDKINPLELVLGKKEIEAFQCPTGDDTGKDTGRSPIVRYLLDRFFPKDNSKDPTKITEALNALEIHDARMFVNVAYGLAGPRAEPAVMRRLFSLALFVDRPEDTFPDCRGHAYDPDWVDQTLKEASLGLWEANGIYSGATNFSNAHLGAGHFFCEIAAPRHVPQMYERMLIQALFYQASLRHYALGISNATETLVADPGTLHAGARKFRELRQELIRFTNRYWFHELTPQIQGKALFELQQKGLGLEREYDLIKDEMERTDEFLSAARAERFTIIAVAAAILALWIALLPVIPIDGTAQGPVWTLEAAGIYLRRLLHLSAVVAILSVATWALYKGLSWMLRQLRRLLGL